MVAALLLFGIYTSAMWSSRSNFCAQMNGLVLELPVKATRSNPNGFRPFKRSKSNWNENWRLKAGPSG